MRTAKGFLFFLLAVLAVGTFFSCKNEKVDVTKYMEERDSILKVSHQRELELSELDSVLTTIAEGLDSIAVQENVLYSNKSKDGVLLDKKQIMANLNFMANLLARQRMKMKILQDSLAMKRNAGTGIAKMQHVINFLNQQLSEKDDMIKSLRADLNNKNKDISQLRASLASLKTKSDNVEKKNEVLTKTLAKQDDMMNECYMKIGTKKQLKSAGILKSSFLSKAKLNYQAVDKSNFIPVDIRKMREIRLNSDNPKILSPMPNPKSFHFEDNGDRTCTLKITNPAVFWSVSNFLIIQL